MVLEAYKYPLKLLRNGCVVQTSASITPTLKLTICLPLKLLAANYCLKPPETTQ